MSDKYNHFKLKDIIEREYKDQGYEVFHGVPKEPKLPIHLYCEYNKGKPNEELLLIHILTAGKIDSDLVKILHCWQLMIHPALKVLLFVIPEYELDEDIKSLLKRDGIGLRKFNKDLSIKKKTIIDAKSIRQRIQEKYILHYFYDDRNRPPEKDAMSDFNLDYNDVKEISWAAAKSSDDFLSECVIRILEDPPSNIGQSNIDVQCMRLTSELKNVVYKDMIKESAEEYFSTNPDDYEFALKWTSQLWGKYIDLPYPDVHKDMDPILQSIYPEYRDHFLHQYQVFILGVIILDRLIEHYGSRAAINENIQYSWLLASTFHDFAYSLQLYNNWSSRFFNEFLLIGKNINVGMLALDRIYLEESFSSSIEFIISILGKAYENNGENETETFNKLRLCFYEMISQKKDHGLLSSMSLLKIANKNGIEIKSDKYSDIILPASFAAAIHNDDVWKILNGTYQEEDNDENEIEEQRELWIKQAADIKILPNLHFKKHPVAFLLIFCDSIQEWGRSPKSKEMIDIQKNANIKIRDIKIESNEVTVNLIASRTKLCSEYLNNKRKEFEKIEEYLKSTEIPFNIRIFDRQDEKEMSDMHIRVE